VGFFPRLAGGGGSPRAATQPAGGGTLIVSPAQLEEALRSGNLSSTGQAVTPETAMRVATVYACVRILSGAIATTPLHVKERVDENIRRDRSDHNIAQLLRRKPNRWQKPHQFKRMLQAHVLLRGNAFALKVRGVGRIQELIPLHPDRVIVRQLDDWSLEYEWTRRDGTKVRFAQEDILHFYGLTLDGFTGVTPLTYARESIGLSLAMDGHVGKVMKKGARASGVLRTDKQLSDKAFQHLKESLDDFRSDGDKEGEVMLLEEGLDYKQISMSPADLQWIESRKLSRSEIAMFFGVPPSMIGDNSGSDSNWGTGLEQKSIGFRVYSLEDHYTMWEEGIDCDLLASEPKLYSKFNRAAQVQGDLKTRTAAYASALQWGWMSPDDVRRLEDMNPRPDGEGGQFYPPPNTAGKTGAAEKDDDDDDDAPPPRQR
jgi:HK97 family phage portal protein